jgi:hypothetical protein
MKTCDTILDWTHYLKDEELRDYTGQLYRRNKECVAWFEKYGIPHCDVSNDRNRVLRQLERDVLAKAAERQHDD